MIAPKKTLPSIAYVALALIFLFPLCLRDNYHISDAGNYILHTTELFQNRDLYKITEYPLYWIICSAISKLVSPGNGPSALAFVVLSCMVISSLQLSIKNRFLFLFFIILNGAIFNTSLVALRNGVALGVVLLALAYRQHWLIWVSIFIHPGVAPMVAILEILRKTKDPRYLLLLFPIILFALFFLYPIFIQSAIEDRGYTQGVSRQANIFTYFVTFVLSCLFYLSMKGSRYRLFLPIMFFVWVFLGAQSEFGGRAFLQAFLPMLFLFLSESNRNKYKIVFLLAFFAYSVYGAFVWHPLTAYYDGWIGYWGSLLL